MMDYILKKEFWKIVVLIVLITLSILQIGILWSYQSYGLPFCFFEEIFGYNNKNEQFDSIRQTDNLLQPKRIAVIDNSEPFYLMLSEDSKSYQNLWNEAKNYLIDILSSTNLATKVEHIPMDDWRDKLKEEGFFYEFETRYEQKTVRMLLNLSESSSEKPKGIVKMIIAPFESSVQNDPKMMCVFLLDNDNLYRVCLNITDKMKSKKWYEKVLHQSLKNKELIKYELSGKYFFEESNALVNIDPDLFIAIRGRIEKKMSNVKALLPEKLMDISLVSKKLLGKSIKNFITYIDNQGSIVFQKVGSYYKISQKGVLQYKCKQYDSNEEKGAENQALEKSLDFLDQGENLLASSEAKIALTNITENNNYYIFTFNYKIKDTPIAFIDKGNIDNAITIIANSKKVLECKWHLKIFNFNTGTTKFNEYFMKLANSKDIKLNENKIEDVSTAYGIINDEGNILKPCWIVKTDDGKYSYFKMNIKY